MRRFPSADKGGNLTAFNIGDNKAHLIALMLEHGLKQSNLTEIGSQGVLSEILPGKYQINVRQTIMLTRCFTISPAVFI